MPDLLDLVDSLAEAHRDTEKAQRMTDEVQKYFRLPEIDKNDLERIKNESKRVHDFLEISFDYISSSQDRIQAIAGNLDIIRSQEADATNASE